MPTRFGDRYPLPSPPRADRTRILIARIMLGKPNIQFECSDEGIIKFQLPRDNPAIMGGDLANTRLMRTRWFADAVGGYLVHSSLNRLGDIVCRSDYADLAAQHFHSGFGLIINPRNLEFICHCELLSKIFNEHLKWELRGIHA